MVRPLPRKKENVRSNLITGSSFMNEELTEEEEVHYVNYSLIDLCDCCHEYFPIHNYNDGKNYLTWTGKYLYCQKCIKEK